MKKTTAVSLMILAVFSVANVGGLLAAGRAVDLSQLPPELVLPARLPAAIQDAWLLEAWVRLDAHTEPITLWDGRRLTGHDLAQFILDQAIPVVWNQGAVCGGASCSEQHCDPETHICTYADAAPGIDPIYIAPEWRADMPGLVGVLAHEIFHRLQPFGPVPDSRFEEYWGMVILARLSPAGWLRIGEFDPFNPDQLVLWIDATNLDWYYALQAYPPSITPLDLTAASAGDPYADLPNDARGTR